MFFGQFLTGSNSESFNASILINANHLSIHYADKEIIHEIKWRLENTYHSNPSESNLISFKNHEFPTQELKMETSTDFIKRLTSAKNKNAGFYLRNWQLRGVFLISIIIGLFIGICSFFYFKGLPILADNAAKSFPITYEIQLGEEIYKNSISTDKIDSAKSKLLNEFYSNLNNSSEYPIHITYLNEDVVNAFALPGGRIVIYDGIINKMNRYEELAALLAHESSHIIERHSTRTMFKSIGGFALVSILFGDATGFISVIADNANAINNLSYSRELEEEADKKGIDLLLKNHIDLKGMVQLFKTLENEEKKTNSNENVMKFLSTHPLTAERIKTATMYSKKQNKKKQHELLFQLFNKIKSHD